MQQVVSLCRHHHIDKKKENKDKEIIEEGEVIDNKISSIIILLVVVIFKILDREIQGEDSKEAISNMFSSKYLLSNNNNKYLKMKWDKFLHLHKLNQEQEHHNNNKILHKFNKNFHLLQIVVVYNLIDKLVVELEIKQYHLIKCLHFKIFQIHKEKELLVLELYIQLEE